MDKEQWERLIAAWIAGSEAEVDSPTYETNWWALELVLDWPLENEHEKLWHFILMTYTRDISAKAMGMLAAGPLEDLLARFGLAYIEEVECLARGDARFSELLGGVWQNKMTDEVWARVCAVRKTR